MTKMTGQNDFKTEPSRAGQIRLAPISKCSWIRGNCYLAELPEWLPIGDTPKSPFNSPLELLENGMGLTPPHTIHEIIVERGGGSYSHWHNKLYFSAVDNSDPRTNGRDYHVYIPSAQSGPKQIAIQILKSLSDTYSSQEAYAAIEQCLAVLYPVAKIGEDQKWFWGDDFFINTCGRLCDGNMRSLERKYAVYNLVGSLLLAGRRNGRVRSVSRCDRLFHGARDEEMRQDTIATPF